MFKAFERGLLKPDYAEGLKSILRESLILDAIASENVAHDIEVQVASLSSLFGVLAADKIKSHFEASQDLLSSARRLRTLTPEEKKKQAISPSMFLKLFEALSKSSSMKPKEPSDA